MLFKQEMFGQNMEYTEDCPYPTEKIISPNSTNPLSNPRVSRGGCEGQPPPPGKTNVDNVRVCVSEPLLIIITSLSIRPSYGVRGEEILDAAIFFQTKRKNH